MDESEMFVMLETGDEAGHCLKVLLVFNKGFSHDIKILVDIQGRKLARRVQQLMREAREDEAFDLVFRRGEVVCHIPPGRKVAVRPTYTLVEDILENRAVSRPRSD